METYSEEGYEPTVLTAYPMIKDFVKMEIIALISRQTGFRVNTTIGFFVFLI